ncbi:MAG: sulfite exporter TauE/SafE family protein [Planctomycetota bacterium]
MTARAAGLVIAGALIAVVGAVCGIGGGLFAVPLLHYGFGLPLRRSVATSLALVFATSTAATLAELVHADGALLWSVALPLIGGALVGSKYGFKLSKRIPDLALKGLFLVALSLVGARMWWMPAGPIQPAPGAHVLAALEVASVIVLGLLAGAIAPLLGIGGGLVVVPGLLFLLPDIGGLGARAASLAMAVPNAARSLQLYAREGAIEKGPALWFAGGALVGGVLGVELVHIPGVARLGQLLLGGILLVTAARFGVDIARRLGRPPETDGQLHGVERSKP